MTKYSALSLTTSYWKPGDNYIDKITSAVHGKIENDDFVVVSEKAISTALGNMVDESIVGPSLNAKLIARFWMRLGWGYPLGILSHFGPRLLRRLRDYPLASGSRHKQVALQYAGFWQSLMFGSEGGIDGSNLPFSYVSLPLENSSKIAAEIQQQIWQKLRKNVCVIIADTDKTYKFRNFFFTPRPKPLKGIYSFGGTVTYVIGRILNFKRSSTPLAVASCSLQPSEALTITNIADKARGPGSGATVWDMAARFQVDINSVSWEMLSQIRHKPLVIVRKNALTEFKKKQIIA
ncbi:MAG: coenzyme F420-0:L-glutamate ligase [Candidatus Bathyarchaeia archaeon]